MSGEVGETGCGRQSDDVRWRVWTEVGVKPRWRPCVLTGSETSTEKIRPRDTERPAFFVLRWGWVWGTGMRSVGSDRDEERATSSQDGGGRDMALAFLSWMRLLDAAPGATSQ